jgi:hypothetical protein
MWADAMRAIQDDLPDEDFVKPLKTSSDTRDVSVVPNVVGMTADDARRTLESAGFVVNTVGPFNSTLAAGLVAQTSPAGGSTIYTGSTITIYVSGGPNPPTIGPPGGGGGGGGPGGGGPTFGPSPTSSPTCHGRHC